MMGEKERNNTKIYVMKITKGKEKLCIPDTKIIPAEL